ncbi:hypothetical protein [Pseudomonas phage TC6]|uniref:Uncharacterized protein n=1 Tax=Pseudomonas phage TC6 TaxID=2060947 RepID=A0A2H5BQC5_9CAUD|nr:hypothetical protein [Pseudomonas phage TC6]
MIAAFNALLECFVTGLFAALILLGLARLGYMPMLMVFQQEEKNEEDDTVER